VLPNTVSWKLKAAAVAILALGAAAFGAAALPQPGAPDQRPGKGEQAGTGAEPPRAAVARPQGTDLHGDPLPAGALARLGTVRLRHGDGVWSVALSPAGDVLVSGSGSFDPTVRLWKIPSGAEVKRLQAYPPFPTVTGGVLAVALSPDGRTIAAATYGRNRNPIFLWDAHTGATRHVLRGHREGVLAVAFSPDGKALASASYDQTVRLWDPASGGEVRTLAGHQGSAYAVAFSPDGTVLASGGDDRAVRLWDVRTGKATARLEGHKGAVLSVAFARDRPLLASSGGDGTVRLWDPVAARESRTLTGHRGDVSSVALSPDGRLLASASRDGTVRLWDVARGAELRRLPADRLDFSSVAFSADGKRLAAGALSNGICCWDVASGAELFPPQGHRAWVLSLQYSPDGALLASGGADGTVRLWDPGTYTERRRIAVPGNWVRDLAFTPDGKTLAVADGESAFALREVGSGKPLRWFPGHKGGVTWAAFAPDGQTVAAVAGDGKVHLWNARTGAELRVWPGAGEICSVAFSPNGKVLAVGGGFKDQTISLREVSTGKELRRLKGHAYAVASLAFLPGGEALISGSQDGTLRLWDVATGQERLCLRPSPQPEPDGVNGLSLSADGQFVASAGQDRVVRVWELATGAEVRTFRGHQGDVYAVAFAPDGRALASGGRDSTVLVWDAGGQAASGARKARPLSAQEIEAAWADLAGREGVRGERAMWALVGATGQGLSLLRQRLRPIPLAEAARVARLVAELGDNRFTVREAATAELERLGEAAEPALHKALGEQQPLETRRRIERLLGKLEGAERLRATRAVGVLERIGSAEARTILEGLAGGAPEARLTRAARAALERLVRRRALR
jgi:WD40 repeat protein